MTAESRALLPMLWLLACEHEDPTSGQIDLTLREIVFRLRSSDETVTECIRELQSSDFIECIDLVQEPYKNRNQTVTPETETETEERQRRDINSANFVSWWEQYPAKKSKKKAEAIYLGIVKRKEATPELLLAGLLRYNASEEVERGYIKNPTTWLNQGCWEDEHQRKPQQRSELMEAIDRI